MGGVFLLYRNEKMRYNVVETGKSPGCNRWLRKFRAVFLVCNRDFGYI